MRLLNEFTTIIKSKIHTLTHTHTQKATQNVFVSVADRRQTGNACIKTEKSKPKREETEGRWEKSSGISNIVFDFTAMAGYPYCPTAEYP